MNPTITTNQRLVTIALLLLIILAVLLIFGIVAGFLMMGGGMMGGMTLALGASAGVNGGMMKDMMTACTNMMQNFQNP